MRKLKLGDPAPEIGLPDADGKVWNLSDLKGSKTILYFYPADDTSGCTAQACDFRDAMGSLESAGLRVLGVSPQGADSHRAFAAKHGLNFPLLIDADHAVASAYGAWGEKVNYGKTYEGIVRSTFVIDEHGRIENAQYNVKARGHVERLKGQLGL